MHLRPTLTALAVTAALFAVAPPAHASARAKTPPNECSSTYFQGNPLLGPQDLPTVGPVGRELRGYDRTGDLASDVFLMGFRNPTINHGQPGWLFPPFGGFVLRSDGTAVRRVIQLHVGRHLDRYGSVGGQFLAPEGTPFAGRALPPQSLVDPGDPAGCNYHDYEVIKAFKVQAGPATRWFAQPGSWIQYALDYTLVPGAPSTDSDFNIAWLLQKQYLKELPVPH